MISINTNLSSLIAQQSLKQSSNKLNLAVERMSTGFKINHAKDNAANYSISTNMTTKIGAYQVAEDNVAMGLDLLSTANGSLDQISDKLSRLRALAEQSANGTYGAQSRSAINAEANALVDEIERLYNTTEYNGKKLLNNQGSKFIEEIEKRDTSEMTTLESMDGTVALTSGTYSISTAEGLAKLATMTNNGLIGADTEFVLANDIDLKKWCEDNSATGGWVPIGMDTDYSYSKTFKGTFDGNGYEISNLTINRNSVQQGLFGYIAGGSVSNLAVVNVKINGGNYTAGLTAQSSSSKLDNCYVTGTIVGNRAVAGLVGSCGKSEITSCYASVDVVGTVENLQGGLIAWFNSSTVSDSFSEGSVTGLDSIGGLLGSMGTENGGTSSITNCYSSSIVTTTNGGSCGGLVGNTYNYGSGEHNYNITNSGFIGSGDSIQSIFSAAGADVTININGGFYSPSLAGLNYVNTVSNDTYASSNIVESAIPLFDLFPENKNVLWIDFQVGVNSKPESSIRLNLGIVLDNLSIFRNITHNPQDFLSYIDDSLLHISSKQTEFGAVQNRLESALDEISTQYENLVSSRSTLRDADISEVSSEYIRQQILQEASATLLATANQSPSIALQLI